MRVRIARNMYNSASLDFPGKDGGKATGVEAGLDEDIFGLPQLRTGRSAAGNGMTNDEQDVLDRVGEDLARLGRVKRVALGVEEKIEFVKVWTKRKR